MPRKRAPREARPADRSLVAALANPACYAHDVAEVRVVETHISWVFLTGKYAYKVKKPVKLPFADFSSLERRRELCHEEVRLNRRLAAEIYLGVVPIGGTTAAPRIGRRPAFEYAVKMRQFADDARLDRQVEADTLPPAALRDFAAQLAEFHRRLPPLRAPRDSATTTLRTVAANLDELEPFVRGADRERFAAVREWTARTSRALGPVLARRAAAGAHRECHGDLHLENLLYARGRIVAFDALEFDLKLRAIDVASETAFLVMDLLAHRRADLAYGFLNRYLETGGDYHALAVLRFFLVYRALVRAKVRALKASQKAAEAGRDALEPYFDLAAELVRPRTPLLVITHGLSGSGKTHVTDELLGRLPAVRIRSDIERKRLHGLPGHARTRSGLGGGVYAAEATRRTYARLADAAAAALAGGFDAIADATFLRQDERGELAALAAARGARFAILECAAPESVLRERIASRTATGRDASEATGAVLDRQLAAREPFTPEERAAALRVDTSAPVDYGALVKALAAR